MRVLPRPILLQQHSCLSSCSLSPVYRPWQDLWASSISLCLRSVPDIPGLLSWRFCSAPSRIFLSQDRYGHVHERAERDCAVEHLPGIIAGSCHNCRSSASYRRTAVKAYDVGQAGDLFFLVHFAVCYASEYEERNPFYCFFPAKPSKITNCSHSWP